MALDKYFPEDSIQIIAEPGRYFVASAFTIGVNVIAKRVVTRDRKGERKCCDQEINNVREEVE